jgi:hypothetical protein
VPQSSPEFFGPFAASGGCVPGDCRGGSSCAPLGRRELESCDPRAFALLRSWAEFFGPFGPLGSGVLVRGQGRDGFATGACGDVRDFSNTEPWVPGRPDSRRGLREGPGGPS